MRSRSSARPRPRGRLSEPDGVRLRAFEADVASTVLGWITTDDEARHWAALAARPVDARVFLQWHSEPGVHGYLLEIAGQVVGYGEIWEDPDEGEAELARIVVDPALRGQGLGRRLVTLLAGEARRLGYDNVWLRVAPDNAAALASYGAAGFTRATPEEEAAFNTSQPRAYAWMRAR